VWACEVLDGAIQDNSMPGRNVARGGSAFWHADKQPLRL
jgi:hypothetical protein